MNCEITSVTGAMLYIAEIPDNTPDSLRVRAALEHAVARGADLYGANLRGANLSGAYLSGAYLSGANLSGADLRGAKLSDAYLRGAKLSGVLIDANVRLVGQRPVLTIGPIGSRSDWLVAFVTDSGVRLRTGCFFGTVEQFRARLADSDDVAREEYTAALTLVETHARLWTPAADGEQK